MRTSSRKFILTPQGVCWTKYYDVLYNISCNQNLQVRCIILSPSIRMNNTNDINYTLGTTDVPCTKITFINLFEVCPWDAICRASGADCIIDNSKILSLIVVKYLLIVSLDIFTKWEIWVALKSLENNKIICLNLASEIWTYFTCLFFTDITTYYASKVILTLILKPNILRTPADI